ncbi:MAG: carbohydrate porin [Pseudomonadota bacterium]
MIYLSRKLLLAIPLISLATTSLATEIAKDPFEDNLFGHWGGLRDKLSNAGIDTIIEYKADAWSNTSGGIKRGNSYLDNLDVKFAIDGEKLFGIEGNKAMIYFLNNNGGRPNARQVGSNQAIDNIETGVSTAKLYEAWVEQSFLNKKLSVLVGLHDLNSEFIMTDMSANFIKPVMQVSQSFAQSGENGPSIFPTTSLAARVKFTPTEESYFSVAAFDGVAGNTSHPYATRIDFNHNDGLLLVSELRITPKAADSESSPNKFAIGAWTYTEKMDDLVDLDSNGNPVQKRMEGAYFLSSYQVYHNKEAGHDIGLFLRAGIADGDTAQVDWDYTAGIVANGWMPTRSDSEIGLGIAQAHNSNTYVTSVSGVADANEYSYELYYRDKICNGISVQPDLQYIVNPGTDKVAKDATVIGIRFDVNF